MPGEQQVDAIIIGSGQGGVPLANELARRGQQVVVFERDAPGGSCVNFGCTPSKAFLGAAHGAGRARQLGTLGVHCDVRVDFAAVMRRVRAVRQQWQDGVTDRLEGEKAPANLRLVRAEASFTASGSVRGGGQEYRAPLVVIDTGSRARLPEIDGLAEVEDRILTDRNFWELEALPRRTLVIGGGYIGLELGQGLARLGSEVHVVDHNDRVLHREEADVGETLQEALRDDGVRLHLRSRVRSVAHAEERFVLQLESGERLEGDALLVATGRVPNTTALAAEAAGIALDERGYVKVDEQLRTTRAGVYAIGEAAGQPPFTHVAWEDWRRLRAILDGEPRRRDDRVLAYAVYTDPQVGRVGLDRPAAEREGRRVIARSMPCAKMARGIEWDLQRGFYRLLADARTRQLVGATLVGWEAAEVVHVLVDLIHLGATVDDLDRAVHVHPTFAENLPSIARMFADDECD